MLGPELSLHMCVIQLADEGFSPGLASVYTDLHVILSVPLAPLFVTSKQQIGQWLWTVSVSYIIALLNCLLMLLC